MPRAERISLHPLTFHEALKHLVRVDPDSVGIASKRRKQRRRRQPKSEKPKRSNNPE